MSYAESSSQPSRRALRERRQDRRRQRRRKIQALAAGGIVLGVGASATMAAWTDEETSTGLFASGEFAIDAKINGSWEESGQMIFEAANMYPDRRIYASVELRTTATTTIDGEVTISGADITGHADSLAPYLQYRAVVLDPAQAETCQSSAFEAEDAQYVFGTSDTSVSMSGEATSEKPDGMPLVLKANSQNTLAYCFEVRLDQDTPNSAQNKTSKYMWKFNATSIVPN